MVRREPTSPRAESNTPLDSDAVVSFLGGGLNTMTSSINVPRGDSPFILNMDVTDRGNVASRSGTRNQAVISSAEVAGCVAVSVATKTSYLLTFVKVNNDMYVFEATYDAGTDSLDYSQRLLFSNCFADNTQLIRPDSAVITEEDIRVLFTFGIAAPVQFRVVERQTIKTSGASFTSTTFSGTDLEFASTSTLILKVDGVNIAVSSVSYSAGVLTVNHPSVAAGTYTIDLMFVTWQWICQGHLLEGKDLYQMETRFSAAQTDISVTIPVDLIKANESLDDSRYLWPIIPYLDTDRASYYTYQPTLVPTTADEFSFSNGLAYVPATGDKVVPGISHVTFGGLGSGIKEVHFVKALRLDYDNDATNFPVATKPVKVFVNGLAITLYTSATSTDDVGRAAYLREVPATKSNFYSNTSLATTNYKYLTFDAAPTVGIDYTAVVEVIFPYISSTFVGSSAVQDFSQVPRVGYAYPLYGIQEHANYSQGSFPRTCHLFQGRLFLGGFPAEPTKVVATDVAGTSINGDKYTTVSVDYNNLQQTEPFSFIIASSEKGAAITAISDAAGSLIVFTQANSYRVFSSSALAPTTFSVSTVAAVGCVNAHCAVSVSNTVTFLSFSGVYRLSPALQVGDFDINLLSVKVNDLLRQQRNVDVAWMFYDDIENRLYLGVATTPQALVANRMLVYFVQWEAWTEHALFTGYWPCSYGVSLKLNRSYQLYLTFFSHLESEQSCYLLTTGEEKLTLDFVAEGTNWANAQAAGADTYPYIHYDATLIDSDAYVELEEFKLLAFANVRDACVVLNAAEIEEWKKLSGTLIQITARIAATDTIDIHPKNDLGDYPLVLFKDNLIAEYTVTVNASTDEAVIDFDVAPSALSTYRVGFSIPFAYSTGVFVRNNLTADKQHVDFFVMVFNEDYQHRYLGGHVNTAAGQTADELVGMFITPVGIRLGKYVDGVDYVAVAEDMNPAIQWDLDRSDVGGRALQALMYSRVGTSLKGSNDTLRCYAYVYSFRVFCLTAYQMIGKSIGRSLS